MTTTILPDRVTASEEQMLWLERRGWVYQLLVDFLRREPRLSLIAQYRREGKLKGPVISGEGARLLKGYLDSINESRLRQVCYEEADEYMRLFAGSQAVLPLTEGVFRARREGSEALRNISGLGEVYCECGVVFNKLHNERDDHIAIELEFMSVLADRMLVAGCVRNKCTELADMQMWFLESHLLQWAPAFAEALRREARTPLYKGLAVLLSDFLARDLSMLRLWRAALD
ncbi:molecular chaperone TorD family protein [Paenibacillus sp. YPG26]|uniref:TorD/DmsD family molecular chaperone n=1 Tax=Paenibacillus sp. YPG26 TaxID=2878915 RepID=UPI0020405318|nr:molecular chaperone TorD family protein [Paenibacillus sp. YPG26]USB32917.1 molecular chaperone TorD family protein [Paenibacillus sp. YPG26]